MFEDEIAGLHKAGFVYNHIKRANEFPGLIYDNLFLTDTGVRLIDTGNSVIMERENDKLFDKYIKEELKEINEFKEYFLSR